MCKFKFIYTNRTNGLYAFILVTAAAGIPIQYTMLVVASMKLVMNNEFIGSDTINSVY